MWPCCDGDRYIFLKPNDFLHLRKMCSAIRCYCWRTLFWTLNPPPFSCRSRGAPEKWSGEENTRLCSALSRRPELPSIIPKTAKLAFYEHVRIPGRSPSSVRGQVYALFPQGLSVRATCQVMSVHLEAWCLEAGSTDTMAGVEPSVAAPVESGAKGASEERSFNFSKKRKSPDPAAGSPDGEWTAEPASKVAIGA
jgi:hypothetical protein